MIIPNRLKIAINVLRKTGCTRCYQYKREEYSYNHDSELATSALVQRLVNDNPTAEQRGYQSINSLLICYVYVYTKMAKQAQYVAHQRNDC